MQQLGTFNMNHSLHVKQEAESFETEEEQLFYLKWHCSGGLGGVNYEIHQKKINEAFSLDTLNQVQLNELVGKVSAKLETQMALLSPDLKEASDFRISSALNATVNGKELPWWFPSNLPFKPITDSIYIKLELLHELVKRCSWGWCYWDIETRLDPSVLPYFVVYGMQASLIIPSESGSPHVDQTLLRHLFYHWFVVRFSLKLELWESAAGKDYKDPLQPSLDFLQDVISELLSVHNDDAQVNPQVSDFCFLSSPIKSEAGLRLSVDVAEYLFMKEDYEASLSILNHFNQFMDEESSTNSTLTRAKKPDFWQRASSLQTALLAILNSTPDPIVPNSQNRLIEIKEAMIEPGISDSPKSPNLKHSCMDDLAAFLGLYCGSYRRDHEWQHISVLSIEPVINVLKQPDSTLPDVDISSSGTKIWVEHVIASCDRLLEACHPQRAIELIRLFTDGNIDLSLSYTQIQNLRGLIKRASLEQVLGDLCSHYSTMSYEELNAALAHILALPIFSNDIETTLPAMLHLALALDADPRPLPPGKPAGERMSLVLRWVTGLIMKMPPDVTDADKSTRHTAYLVGRLCILTHATFTKPFMNGVTRIETLGSSELSELVTYAYQVSAWLSGVDALTADITVAHKSFLVFLEYYCLSLSHSSQTGYTARKRLILDFLGGCIAGVITSVGDSSISGMAMFSKSSINTHLSGDWHLLAQPQKLQQQCIERGLEGFPSPTPPALSVPGKLHLVSFMVHLFSLHCSGKRLRTIHVKQTFMPDIRSTDWYLLADALFLLSLQSSEERDQRAFHAFLAGAVGELPGSSSLTSSPLLKNGTPSCDKRLLLRVGDVALRLGLTAFALWLCQSCLIDDPRYVNRLMMYLEGSNCRIDWIWHEGVLEYAVNYLSQDEASLPKAKCLIQRIQQRNVMSEAGLSSTCTPGSVMIREAVSACIDQAPT